MDKDDIREWEYREFVKAANRERPYPDEYGPLAAHDALMEAYGLDGYPTAKTEKKCGQTATAAQPGGIFVTCEGGEPPCRE